jgi:2-keto-4-pentenoate hydratase/2-oxohepta-3-ene-1,7-dioic acid hydratase in catechol pathway
LKNECGVSPVAENLYNKLSCFRAVASGKCLLKRDEVKIKAPIQNPEKIICLGMNYVDHCLEQNQPIPEKPILFFKLPSAVIGQGEDIICPDIVKVRLQILYIDKNT